MNLGICVILFACVISGSTIVLSQKTAMLVSSARGRRSTSTPSFESLDLFHAEIMNKLGLPIEHKRLTCFIRHLRMQFIEWNHIESHTAAYAKSMQKLKLSRKVRRVVIKQSNHKFCKKIDSIIHQLNTIKALWEDINLSSSSVLSAIEDYLSSYRRLKAVVSANGVLTTVDGNKSEAFQESGALVEKTYAALCRSCTDELNGFVNRWARVADGRDVWLRGIDAIVGLGLFQLKFSSAMLYSRPTALARSKIAYTGWVESLDWLFYSLEPVLKPWLITVGNRRVKTLVNLIYDLLGTRTESSVTKIRTKEIRRELFRERIKLTELLLRLSEAMSDVV